MSADDTPRRNAQPETTIRRMPWPEGVSRPVATPMQPSVVYAAESPDALDAQYEGVTSGYTYAREGHPNADVLARRIDRLEGATDGLVTGSGMGAAGALMLGLLKSGDHVLGGDQLYGRTLRMLREDLPKQGIATSLVDMSSVETVAAALRPETRMILLEVVSNPTIRLADVDGIAALARERGIRLVVDNTFTTPRSFRPFDHGADIVIHSVTKLLAGHSDATLGYVAARDPGDREAIRVATTTWGFTPSPFDCWIAERGLFTFDLRYDRAEANAAALADRIAGLPGVARVLYPGRADHPDAARAANLLGQRFGNMLSFEVTGGRAAANALVRAMPDLPFAPTLGDVGTTLSHPATSSHRALTPEARAAMGISEGFFRVSVGIEDIALLEADFTRGIAAAAAAAAG
ncbi:trans-sulfuration enzyme family protein [Tropicimonas sediminicola]|uniref:Cystathionine gamma-synthase n=1 Tax=Tropicimonas sediminicola TaxID=1031541 RepID=A0A239JSN2_9RHOB|nr:aminotransferase class I/II-fold pyridoxal phosphate-dependent enzyme [Tropicimonas sediminicola]SNT08857.1 cystathionine gamma-synthase [Tropicimonas sediminicola]